MSQLKHRSYRKVLDISKMTVTLGTLNIPCKIIVYCIPESQNSRSMKVSRINVAVYIGLKHRGHSGWYFKKEVSINIKNPLDSKIFKGMALKGLVQEAYSGALKEYLTTLKNYTGIVRWFDKNSGEGMIKCDVTDRIYMVYACNLIGRKTWYAETACVYLNEGDKVTFNLNGDFVVDIPGIFDAEKWNKLDQSKLAFKCNDEGQAINGLFGE
jgi:hypothetical protein